MTSDFNSMTNPIVPPQPAARDDDLVFSSGGVAPGTYDARLLRIDGPREIEWQGEVLALIEWTFQVATPEGVEEVTGSTTTKTGPKSKLQAWTTNLLGRQPHAGERVPRSALVGRLCTVVVVTTDKGFAKVTDVLPPRRQPQPAPAAMAPLEELPF